MPFCPNCGQRVEESMRFCPSCGSALTTDAVHGTVTDDAYQTNASSNVGTQGNDYRLVLISCGTCAVSTAQELLQNVLGYTASEASTLTRQVPIEIAQSLSFQQALDISRMFTEYGMQIAVYNSSGYVNMNQYATSSVFNSDGSILKTVAVSLAALTAVNRVKHFLRWTIPNPLRFLFTPNYRYGAPPPPRPIHRAPPPPAPARGGMVRGLFGGPGNRSGGPTRGQGGPMGGPGPGGRHGGGPGGPGGPGRRR